MARQERAGDGGGRGGADMDATLAAGIARNPRLRSSALWGGGARSGADEADGDDDLARAAAGSGDAVRLTGRERQRRDMQRAVSAHVAEQRAAAGCGLCLDGPAMRRHCIIALGEHCLLMLPPGGPRLPGHLVLAPVRPCASMREADEDVYAEVNTAKAALAAMYAAQGRDAVFLETVMPARAGGGGGGGSAHRHTHVDVVPLDADVGADAPLYFAKALAEADEWARRKPIDTAGKGLRRAIPPGFPYFHVSWAGGGLVHVIEEEEASFDPAFGIDTCAGMAGIVVGEYRTDAAAAGRRGRGGSGRLQQQRRPRQHALSFEQEKQAVLDFIKGWAPYDWTSSLDGGGDADASGPVLADAAAGSTLSK